MMSAVEPPKDTVFEDLGVRVGLEIHQQLATGRKLFCRCPPAEPQEHPIMFRRALRSSTGEVGGHDPAALFEEAKAKVITYYAHPASSCLVEQDEEPPHALDERAKKTALVIAAALKSRTYTEIHAMRKTVVDGSNTTGFQRTMLVSQGGSFDVQVSDEGLEISSNPKDADTANNPHTNTKKRKKIIGIQSICLEEDAAKILEAESSVDIDTKGYGLERLGVPLVEIATEPFEVKHTGQVREVALSLGRILRSTRMVTRGLGSIRQDVNVSIKGSSSVVEVKGVQQLDQLGDVVKYEALRQHGLLAISNTLQGSKWNHDASQDRADVSDILFDASESKIIQKAQMQNLRIMAVAFRRVRGIFGYEPHKNVRLGKEIAELVKRFGVGGIFHTDELPAYGITEQDVAGVHGILGTDPDRDAFIMLAAPAEKIHTIIDQAVARVDQIASHGIPADTRLAMADGTTAFLRPRPGAARMYPETDVPTITVSNNDLDAAVSAVPKPWDAAISELQSTYGINAQLAEQLWDSQYLEIFEEIAADMNNKGVNNHNNKTEDTPAVSPLFVASTLCSTITSLERQKGLDASLLNYDMIRDTFGLLSSGKIVKESVVIIFESIMSSKSRTVKEAIESASMTQSMTKDDLRSFIDQIIKENMEMIANQKERAAGPLMGKVMKQLRGKAPGSMISALVSSGIADALEK